MAFEIVASHTRGAPRGGRARSLFRSMLIALPWSVFLAISISRFQGGEIQYKIQQDTARCSWIQLDTYG